MQSVQNPHDKFFKEMFSRRESAIEFMGNYLPPEVSKLLDLSTLEQLKDSFVDQQLQNHFSDLLYQVQMRDGGECLVYILFEHKSYIEREIAFQLLRYMVRIWETQARYKGFFAPIFPLVVYHGKLTWKVSLHFRDLFSFPAVLQRYLPDYQYALCDLGRYSDSDLKGNVMLQVGLLTMKYIFHEELAEKLPGIFSLLRNLTQQKTGLGYLETLLRYLASANTTLSEQELQTAVMAAIAEGGDQIMPTLAQKWIEEGRQEGLQKGRQEGMQQGIKMGLLEVIESDLHAKFSARGLKELIRIRQIEDLAILRAIRTAIQRVSSLEELQQVYEEYLSELQKEHKLRR